MFVYAAEYILTTPMNLDGRDRSAEMVHSANHLAEEEMNRAFFDSEFLWDNARPRSRQGRVGDLFGFAYTAGDYDEIDLRVILEVRTPLDRRPQWDVDVPDHRDRAAIVLSDSIGWIASSVLASSNSNECPWTTQQRKAVGCEWYYMLHVGSSYCNQLLRWRCVNVMCEILNLVLVHRLLSGILTDMLNNKCFRLQGTATRLSLMVLPVGFDDM